MQDAEQWAAFSGDNNPIHFSVSAARQMGLDRLCLHGMRAMLDIKASLGAEARSILLQEPSLLFSCRLDKPIFYQQGYVLQAEQLWRHERLRLRSRLSDAINQEGCLNAKLVTEPTLMQSFAGRDGEISRQEIASAAQQLSAMTGQRLDLWNVMDAVLFKQLIHSPATMCRVRDVLPELDHAELSAALNQVQMVQTHHETSFASRLLIADTIAVFGDPLHFSIFPAQVVGKSHRGFILHIAIQAYENEKALMRTSVTLKATLTGAK
jgi:hypothetical protein